MCSSLMLHPNLLHLGPPDFTSFKLYDNPHYYNDHDIAQHHPYQKPPNSAPTMQDKGTQHLEIDCLRAELETERRMRRKFESLNRILVVELAEERRAREEAERRLRLLEGEVTCNRVEVEKALTELEEERGMLRVAELWREERVQIKLSEAKLLMEEKIREITEFIYLEETAAAAAASKADEVGPTDQSNNTSKGRKEAENPHIRRGIRGFVEFPKTIIKVQNQAKETRVDLESNLECQRAQLRVLLRNNNKGSNALGIIGNAQNLVM